MFHRRQHPCVAITRYARSVCHCVVSLPSSLRVASPPRAPYSGSSDPIHGVPSTGRRTETPHDYRRQLSRALSTRRQFGRAFPPSLPSPSLHPSPIFRLILEEVSVTGVRARQHDHH